MMLDSKLPLEFCIARITVTSIGCRGIGCVAGVRQKCGSLLACIVGDEAQHIAQRQRCGLSQLLLLNHLRIIV